MKVSKRKRRQTVKRAKTYTKAHLDLVKDGYEVDLRMARANTKYAHEWAEFWIMISVLSIVGNAVLGLSLLWSMGVFS